MEHNRLLNLALINLGNDVLRSLNYDIIIHNLFLPIANLTKFPSHKNVYISILSLDIIYTYLL